MSANLRYLATHNVHQKRTKVMAALDKANQKIACLRKVRISRIRRAKSALFGKRFDHIAGANRRKSRTNIGR